MATKARTAKFTQVVENRRNDIVVVMEDIYDPHNAAAIYRTMDAFGLYKVYLVFKEEEEFNPKKVGKASSSSANKWMEFAVYAINSNIKTQITNQIQNSNNQAKYNKGGIKECLQDLKKEGYTIVGTILDKEAENIYEHKWVEQKIALLVGNEHRGLSPEAIALCDQKIYIPMKGLVQSLNVSVATALSIAELCAKKTLVPMSANTQKALLENYLGK